MKNVLSKDERKKIAVRLNLDYKTVRMLEKLSIQNAGSKSQAARKAIENEWVRQCGDKSES